MEIGWGVVTSNSHSICWQPSTTYADPVVGPWRVNVLDPKSVDDCLSTRLSTSEGSGLAVGLVWWLVMLRSTCPQTWQPVSGSLSSLESIVLPRDEGPWVPEVAWLMPSCKSPLWNPNSPATGLAWESISSDWLESPVNERGSWPPEPVSAPSYVYIY